MRRRSAALRGGRRRERGAALVELAAAIPILLMLVVGTVDFGRVFYRSMAVAQAARAGAEWGAQSDANSTNATGIKTAAKNAVAADLTLVDGDITWTRSCECATAAGVFSATSPPNDCTAACASGSHMVVALNVSVAKSCSTVIDYPLIPHVVPITRTVKIRVK